MPEETQKPSLISKDTYVSIALVGSILGGVIWLTTMYADIGYLKQTIADLKSNVQTQTTELKNSIQAQISEIKSDIKEIKQLITKQNS
jgi:hypothetical protein